MAHIPPELHDRYGLTRQPAKIIGRLLVVLAVIVASVAIALQFIGRGPEVKLQNLGHVVNSESEVTIKYQVHTDPGVELECSATAVNDDFAEVGARTWSWTTDESTETRELVLQTSEKAASGSIEYCVPTS
ncbi:MAG: DUF4307 domain-containing protein [Flaviflexus sp.]|uniref:DUF4307 domain-containing protein n=1 Tax=Flaviflexus sp. TaxID=1969482 RepID=UPI00352E499B